jgi:hypothetical protein
MRWLGLLAAARRGRQALQAPQLAAAVRVAQRRAHPALQVPLAEPVRVAQRRVHPALQVLPVAEAGPAARAGHAVSDVI